MKNITYIILILVAVIFTSCEKVVDVDLNTAPPRLVVDASINWTKGTSGSDQKIKLSTSADYFGNTVPAVSGATVFITDSNQTVYNFTESGIAGEYICNNFVPTLNLDYVLTVIYNGETYTATETMKPVPPIDKIVQSNDGGVPAENLQIKVYFTDDGATDDFYMFKFTPSITAIPFFGVTEDKFFQGNQIFGIYTDEDLVPGDKVEITLSGISKRYFNYMQKLINLSGGASGGPFQTPPATVRGNIINNTNEDNFAFGYFNVSETNHVNYTFE